MAATATLVSIGPQPVDTTQNQIIAKYKITFSGTYSAASLHGDTISLADARVTATQVPVSVQFSEAPPAGTAPTGYVFTYCPGTNQTNGRVCVTQGANAAPNAEITQNSSYPAALTATTYVYLTVFIPSL